MSEQVTTMQLKVLLPSQVLVDEDAVKINAEALNGGFCLLPRHADFATALTPGLFYYTRPGGEEQVLAVNEGVLVKVGQEVLVSTRAAVRGADLGHLQAVIRDQFAHLDDRERQTRSALARIEADFVRRFMELCGGIGDWGLGTGDRGSGSAGRVPGGPLPGVSRPKRRARGLGTGELPFRHSAIPPFRHFAISPFRHFAIPQFITDYD
jgi:F-type H+-transporting ATPase subunit epsilon